MKKNKMTSIRINEKILEVIKKSGLSPQRIVDEWIKKYIQVNNVVKPLINGNKIKNNKN